MVHEFAILTVRHTGTHFIQKFFNELGFEDRYYGIHCPPSGFQPYQLERLRVPTIVTARDPNLSAFHYLSHSTPKYPRNIESMGERWNNFIAILPTLNYYLVDIECEEQYKHKTLRNALTHIGYDPDTYEPNIKDYAARWKPLNTTENKMKLEYFETGKLPKGHDWSVLDQAVDWYKNLPANNA